MPESNPSPQIGRYRPIYLWAGPGTIRMNRLKFMNQPVDEAAHHQAHGADGVRCVITDMYCSWAYLTYNWGFPPEIEREDWNEFEYAAKAFQENGGKVFAYIQTSNCVYQGSFVHQDWYALDRFGKKIYYYSGRFMTCLRHPAWIAHLKDRIQDAIQRGSDGIFFDNLWHGAMPISLAGVWLGEAGCHCPRCQGKYTSVSGEAIPLEINPKDPASGRYLRWRADQVTELLSELASYTRQLKPDVLISVNNYDIFNRNSFLIFGLDFPALASIQDVVMIENHSLLRYERDPKPVLVNNAVSIRNSLPAIDHSAHLSVLSYDQGIGFDGVYHPRRYQQAIAEAAACGASMTIKGTEYFQDGQHTTLTPSRFAHIHQAIGAYHRWLDSHVQFYQNRISGAPVGLLYPGDELWPDWHRLAPTYFAAGQALLFEGIPWKVVTKPEHMEGVQVILVFQEKDLERFYLPTEVQVLYMPSLSGWGDYRQSALNRSALLRTLLARGAHGLLYQYHRSRLFRRLIDRAGLPKLIIASPLFEIPAQGARNALLDAIQKKIAPRLRAPHPSLIEVWHTKNEIQVHLVNYVDFSQNVQIIFEKPLSGYSISPDEENNQPVSGQEIDIQLDIYKVLIFPK